MNVGCPAGLVSYNEACYRFSTHSKSWSDARAECKELGEGYDLAVINDMAENEYLKSNLPKAKDKHRHWIGLKENGTKGYFSWINGIAFEYGKEFSNDPWGEDQPHKVISIITDLIQLNAIIISDTMTIPYIITHQLFVA